jgi:EmrB/QacA subfamily drug resistance transporter
MATTTFISGERIDYAAILPHRTKMIIMASVLLGLFLSALDGTIVATALPAIVSDLDGLALVGWISTGYLLASTAMVPIYGKLSDIYGRRPILVTGIVVFVLGSALCGLATNMLLLVAARVVQGIGAAALTSTAFAIPADLFTPAERPRYMGLFGAVFGLASVIGPFLGGLLTDRLSWHWVFFVNLPLGALALAFVLAKMPKLASGLKAPIDWLGTALLLLAVVPLLLGLTLDKSVNGWTSPLILGLFATGALATAALLFVETRVPSPVIALSLFRNRTYSVAIVASVLNGAAFFGAIMFISLFLVNVLGTSATVAGSAQIPLMLAFVTGSVSASWLVQRLGRTKPFVLFGFALMLIGLVLLTQIGPQSTTFDVAWRMVVLGLGMGPALPLLNLAVQNAVPFEYIGQATASRQFFLQLGQATGAAIFGVLLSTALATQIATNVTPLVNQLPPNLQSAVDIAELSAVGGGEGVATAQASLSEQLVAAAASPEQQAEARAAGAQIDAALRQSFAASIVSIYWYTVWLAGLALVAVAVFLPDATLRKSNRPEHAAVALE